MNQKAWLFAALLIPALGWSQAADDCAAVGSLTPICGLQAPEDIEVLPLRERLLLSQYGGVDGKPGSLVVLNPGTMQARRVYPAADNPSPGALWGEKSCVEPPRGFSPHGIHLSRRLSGEWQLLVVNHGGRESVEFFHLQADESNRYSLAWKGCVSFARSAYLNDVVALPDGGFLVTHMFDKTRSQAAQRAVRGDNPGHVWRWSIWEGLSRLGSSKGDIPNGIALSPDARFAFVNYYAGGELRKIELRSGKLTAKTALAQPDNSSWLPDGRLLVVSQGGDSREALSCASRPDAVCEQGFTVQAIDPNTLKKTVILKHRGAPMGAASVAQLMGEHLFIGSYVGDRVMRSPWPVAP